MYRLRLYGVALSGGMAGLAGGLMMVPTNFNDYTHFPEELSIKMFALAMAFGGSRLISAIPGAIILIFLPVWLLDRNWVVEYGWVGLVKSEGFIYAALLLLTAYLTKGRGFMSLFERRGPKTQTAPVNKRVTSVVGAMAELETQLTHVEGLVADHPDIRSRQDSND